MGTQQILMIVLSVIIVGVAVAVGITMFKNQAINSNRQACISDMNNFAAQIMAWQKTPTSQGGNSNGALDAAALAKAGAYVDPLYASSKITNQNGTYTFALDGTTGIKITAAGTETGVAPTLTVTVATGAIVVAP